LSRKAVPSAFASKQNLASPKCFESLIGLEEERQLSDEPEASMQIGEPRPSLPVAESTPAFDKGPWLD
jgi:hypothetical protein